MNKVGSRLGLALAGIVLLTATARGEEPAPDPETPEIPEKPDPVDAPALDPAMVTRLHDLYDKHDYVGVRRELLAAYKTTAHPSLLFALGQVELALDHYQVAIDYYERFIATRPSQEQIDLAGQAVAAARLQLSKQKPRRHRQWHAADTGLAVIGSLFVATGAGLFVEGRHVSFDHSGSLTDYDARIDRARLLQWGGAGAGTVGAIVIATTVLRWRLRPEDGYEVTASASGAGASVTVGGRW